MAETTALSVIAQDPERSLAFVESIGERLALGMKGVKNKATGTAVALQMICEGLSPAAFEAKYHIYDGGGFSPRAEWIHAEMIRRGWKVKWVASGEDGKRAAVELSKDGDKHVVEFTIDMAHRKKLGMSDGKKFKADSAWAKDPAQMLRSKLWGRAGTMLEPSIGAGMQEDGEHSSGEPDDGVIDASFTVTSDDRPAETPPKKKRGRDDSVEAIILRRELVRRASPSVERKAGPPKKKRGRPPKKKQDTSASSSGEQTETATDTQGDAAKDNKDEKPPESEGTDATADRVDPEIAQANKEAAAATAKGESLKGFDSTGLRNLVTVHKATTYCKQAAAELFGDGVTLNDMSNEQGHQLHVMCLIHLLQMTDKLGAALQRAGVERLQDLPLEPAKAMIAQLSEKLGN